MAIAPPAIAYRNPFTMATTPMLTHCANALFSIGIRPHTRGRNNQSPGDTRIIRFVTIFGAWNVIQNPAIIVVRRPASAK
jgi:hypothetical protein